MNKLILAVVVSLIVILCTNAFAVQYQCTVSRSNGVFTSGTINESDGTVSYTTNDDRDSYTSGVLSGVRTKDISLKGKEIDNVSYCTNIATTVTIDNFNDKKFTFKNNNGNSLTFYNCEEVQEPEVSDDDPCQLDLPESPVCPAVVPKSITDRTTPEAKKKPHKPSGAAKNPFSTDKKKPKLKQPSKDNMCPT